MRTIATLLTVLITLHISNAQKTYLKIKKSENANDYVTYPPETAFELKNEHGYIIMKYTKTPRVVKIGGNYKLTVYPSWNKKGDVYHLTSGQVESVSTNNSGQEPYRYNISIDKDDVTAHIKVSDSETLPGKKNLYLELSNGISFTYTNGKYYAQLKDKYLDVKSTYIVQSKLGTLKLSFNPENGKVWWVFDDIK